jgi:thiamine-monophosphate kinase
MDVSDGLAGDLAKLCRVSGVSAEIDVPLVPLSEGARSALTAENDLIDAVLTGGDDYEILCTIPEDRVGSFTTAARQADIPVTEIGRIVSGDTAPLFRDRDGKPLTFARASFSHF